MKTIEVVVDAVRKAESIFVCAGAGMGVDSGLPDFRGVKGLWKYYPSLKERKLDLPSVADPRWFATDPHFAWGFYGHRLNLYRDTEPHEGFRMLQKWNKRLYVFTSNVDGHFQRAGVPEENVFECHGSIHYTQKCDGTGLYPAPDIPAIDAQVLHMQDLPYKDGQLLRPNILMFNDQYWNYERSKPQEARMQRWLQDCKSNTVVFEIGAGTAVPTVRYVAQSVASKLKTSVVRVNPDDGILGLGALAALRAIHEAL